MTFNPRHPCCCRTESWLLFLSTRPSVQAARGPVSLSRFQTTKKPPARNPCFPDHRPGKSPKWVRWFKWPRASATTTANRHPLRVSVGRIQVLYSQVRRHRHQARRQRISALSEKDIFLAISSTNPGPGPLPPGPAVTRFTPSSSSETGIPMAQTHSFITRTPDGPRKRQSTSGVKPWLYPSAPRAGQRGARKENFGGTPDSSMTGVTIAKEIDSRIHIENHRRGPDPSAASKTNGPPPV